MQCTQCHDSDVGILFPPDNICSTCVVGNQQVADRDAAKAIKDDTHTARLNELRVRAAIAIVSNSRMVLGYERDFDRACSLADRIVDAMAKRGWTDA